LLSGTSISKADVVIEIGAGRGALTRPLARASNRLLAVELDAHLAAKLRDEFQHRAEIVQSDVRSMTLPAEPYKVIGNIPYSITTDIVRLLVSAPNPPLDVWLVVQREAAYRFCGLPYVGESLWSLRLKPAWHVEIIDRLRRTDFDPPPRVESAFVWLSRRGRPLLSIAENAVYDQVVTEVFRTGAMLSGNLRRWMSKTQLRRLANDLRIDVDGPPTALCFEHWLGIARFISRQGKPP